MKETVLITGVLGQDGSYLADLLLEDGYNVVGLRRRSSAVDYTNVQHHMSNPHFNVEICDITDPSSIFSAVSNHKPYAIFNMAAQSHVHVSFSNPIHTFEVDTLGVMNILEAIRLFSPCTRLYQASTSEMFGSEVSYKNEPYIESIIYNNEKIWRKPFQNESTKFSPESPYAVAKVAAHQMCQLYRKAYGLHISCGILFNHESPRRGKEFVTRKVTNYIGQLVNGKTNIKLGLGNLQACRDWGHAKDYMKAAIKMVKAESGDDYVISTGVTNTIETLCEYAFSCVNLNWQDYVEVDKSMIRPSEVPYLLGSSEKAKTKLGWEPTVDFKTLIKEMVEEDVKRYSDR